MLQLATYWDTLKGQVKTDTFNVNLNHYIEFKRNEYKLQPEQIEQLAKRVTQYKQYIKNIHIQTFSSIEGSSEGNVKLQKERATEIKNVLAGMTDKDIDMEVEANENWDTFYARSTALSSLT